MNTPLELAQDYLLTHELRAATGAIYLSATRALLRHFGHTVTLEDITHRNILAWRRKALEGGLSKQSWNTYSSHLRTVWGYALEQGTLTYTTTNPFKKTSVIPPKRPCKTVAREAIKSARCWLTSLVIEEKNTNKRSKITPAWFWLAVFEMFYDTGIRLNALLNLRYQDIDWKNRLIRISAETEKTHQAFSIPITPSLEPYIRSIQAAADTIGFKPSDQLFNVNRFSRHYRSIRMNTDQVEGMYRKLLAKFGIRMTPHRFRHTLATDLMRQPERNIHLTKSLLNHSNIATTMGYIEVDYDVMRAAMHERSLIQGAIALERRVDEQMPIAQRELLTVEAKQELIQVAPTTTERPALTNIEEVESIITEAIQPVLESSQNSKLLTHVECLPSERYSLEQAILAVGTGLSHELQWDGPGTWWQDLALPPVSKDEGSESSALLMLMINRSGIKSHNW